MRTHTYIFKDSIEENIPFTPMQTIVSEEFGRHFFIDIGFHFLSAPSYKDGGYDESQLDYVNNFNTMIDYMADQDDDVITLDSLLEIYRKLCWNQWQEDKDKAREEYLELEHAVETGDIVYF